MTGRWRPPPDHEALDVGIRVQPDAALTFLHRFHGVRPWRGLPALESAEQRLYVLEHLPPVEVAHDREHRIRGVVVTLVELDDLSVLERFDIALPADRIVAIRMGEEGREHDR